MSQRLPAEAFPVAEFIKEEMDARGWNQIDLANVIGRSPKDVHSLLAGKVAFKPDVATLLGDAFGTGPEYWMNLETAYRAWLTSRETRDAVALRGRLYEAAPVREMQKRGWIRPTKDVEQLHREVLAFYGAPDIESISSNYVSFAARTGTTHTAPNYVSNAWAVRAKSLASAVTVTRTFSDASLADCLARLRLLLSDAEEVRHVPRILAEHGIRFLVVEHLPHTKLDGACLWLDSKSPIIVLSMRFERLDWFWFTLAHELGHVKARDGVTTGGIVDADLIGQDAKQGGDKPEYELAADRFGANFLIPSDELNGFIARVGPLYSRERVSLFAKRINVHPALVVGQLQYREEIEYFHHRDLLKDKVRAAMTSNALTDGWGHSPLSAK